MDNTSGVIMISNKTYDIEKLNEEKIIESLFILIFYIILLVIGIVGNVLVLVVYKHKLKRSSARVYIISLAFADLFVCTAGIPYTTLDKIWLITYTNASVCKTLTFFLSAGSFCSVFVLLVVGLDRYLKVCRPLKRQIRDFGNRKACILAIIVGILVGIPIIELYGTATYLVEPGITEYNCYVDDEYRGGMFATVYLSLYILIFIASVLYLIIMYGFICKKIYDTDKMEGEIVLKKRRGLCGCVQDDYDDNDDELNEEQCTDNTNDKDIELQNLRQSECIVGEDTAKPSGSENTRSTSERKKLKPLSSGGMIRHIAGKKQQKATRKITLMMLTITIVFIVAYLPFLMISILSENVENYWEDMGKFNELVHDFLQRFYLVNNVANPIIYCFWDKRFRKECVRLLKKYLCCSGDTDDSPKNSSSSSGVSRDTTMYSVHAKA